MRLVNQKKVLPFIIISQNRFSFARIKQVIVIADHCIRPQCGIKALISNATRPALPLLRIAAQSQMLFAKRSVPTLHHWHDVPFRIRTGLQFLYSPP